MFDNLIIAESVRRVEEKVFILRDNLPDFFRPKGLFFGGSKEEPLARVMEWTVNRILPIGGRDSEKLLEEQNRIYNSPLAIISKTKACLMEDGWWISLYDDDSFRQHTTRGRANFPEWDENTFQLKM